MSKIVIPAAELTVSRCFQEHLLAPRMLHYTDRELVYHCRESRACECGGLSETQEGLKRSLPSFFTSEPSATSFSGKPTPSEPRNAQTFRQQHLFKLKLDNLYPSEKSRWGQVARSIHFGELWEDILKAYTRTRLTYDHDILLALSGVSRLMQAYNPGGFMLESGESTFFTSWPGTLSVRMRSTFHPAGQNAILLRRFLGHLGLDLCHSRMIL